MGFAAIVLGLCKHPVLAEDVNAADLRTGYDSGETVVTDLRRIEDGSVISNSHTVKWRIYTDNGRDLFLKVWNSFSCFLPIFMLFHCKSAFMAEFTQNVLSINEF